MAEPEEPLLPGQDPVLEAALANLHHVQVRRDFAPRVMAVVYVQHARASLRLSRLLLPVGGTALAAAFAFLLAAWQEPAASSQWIAALQEGWRAISSEPLRGGALNASWILFLDCLFASSAPSSFLRLALLLLTLLLAALGLRHLLNAQFGRQG
jgi:hypothetical protein